MEIKNKLLYSRREVLNIINEYETLQDIQKRDIEYLKADNMELKNMLFQLSQTLMDGTNR